MTVHSLKDTLIGRLVCLTYLHFRESYLFKTVKIVHELGQLRQTMLSERYEGKDDALNVEGPR